MRYYQKHDRLMANGHHLLSHLGLVRERLDKPLFDKVHLSTHLFARCAHVPRRQKTYKQSQKLPQSPRRTINIRNRLVIKEKHI
jgi:hypothetical protein